MKKNINKPILISLIINALKIQKLDLNTLLPVLFGILGLGGLRTYEKIKNSEGNR